jgi:hypothetical protein
MNYMFAGSKFNRGDDLVKWNTASLTDATRMLMKTPMKNVKVKEALSIGYK